MISTDRKILEEGSDVRVRIKDYGELFDELVVVVFSMQRADEAIRVSEKVSVRSTSSRSKMLYVKDAVRIGSKIIKDSKDGWVITCQDPFETGLAGKKLSKKFGAPLHIQIHTDFKSPFFSRTILNRMRVFISRNVLRKAKAVRAVSERIKKSLLNDPKISVLPIYADTEAIRQFPVPVGFKQRYGEFEKIVLMASRLTKEKDVATAIYAFFAALWEFPRAGLIIIGSGPEESRLKRLVGNLGLEESVVFIPWADRLTVLSHMKIADVFLSSSLYEGYGLSMLEAHAAKARLVATNAGIAPLLADEKAVVRPGDREDMARALKSALKGEVENKPYTTQYQSREEYLKAYKADIERALI